MVPAITKDRLHAIALLAGILSALACPASAQTSPGLRLLIARPQVPWQLQDCQPRGNRPELSWRKVDGPLQISWSGGQTLLDPGTGKDALPDMPAHLADGCFRLELDGQPLLEGALVSRYSARMLKFPVLLLGILPGTPVQELFLEPRLPARPHDTTPWEAALRQRFPSPNPDTLATPPTKP